MCPQTFSGCLSCFVDVVLRDVNPIYDKESCHLDPGSSSGVFVHFSVNDDIGVTGFACPMRGRVGVTFAKVLLRDAVGKYSLSSTTTVWPLSAIAVSFYGGGAMVRTP